MLLPVSHADPAELIAALGARHVVAALILLDILLALRTGLSVCCDPGDVFRLSTSLLIPCFSCRAIAGLVGEISTDEAEHSSTLAGDIVQHATIVASFHAKLTLDVRTPFNVLILICE